MGMRGHVIRIGTTLDDHGGATEVEHARLLRLLYAELTFVLEDPRFQCIQPSLYSTHDES